MHSDILKILCNIVKNPYIEKNYKDLKNCYIKNNMKEKSDIIQYLIERKSENNNSDIDIK